MIVPPEFPGPLDVGSLRILVSAAEQDHIFLTLPKINPVSGAEIHFQFDQSTAQDPVISEVPLLNPVQTDADSRPCFTI
jgi:hypothetical protein